jgi:hypothetical protein
MRWYRVDVNPEPWAVGPLGVGRRNGKPYPYVGPNMQLKAYQEAVKEEILTQDPAMVEGGLSLIFVFWRQVERDLAKNYADVTNLQKATEDAVQGILYENDRATRYVQSFMAEQGPGVEGRVLIAVDSYYEEMPIIPTDVMSTPSSSSPAPQKAYDENPEEIF